MHLVRVYFILLPSSADGTSSTSTFQSVSKKKDFSFKEDAKTQALVTRIKRSSALYKAEKERLGDVELRRRLQEDVYGEQQLEMRDTSLSVGEREKKNESDEGDLKVG